MRRYRVRQGVHFYTVSFNTLNLFELNDGTQGNLKSLLHTRAGKGARYDEGGTETDYRYYNQFLALEQ